MIGIFRSRQLREVQRVVNIPTNLHLVELERAWEEDGHLYLQMELCLKSLNQEIEDCDSKDCAGPTETEVLLHTSHLVACCSSLEVFIN